MALGGFALTAIICGATTGTFIHKPAGQAVHPIKMSSQNATLINEVEKVSPESFYPEERTRLTAVNQIPLNPPTENNKGKTEDLPYHLYLTGTYSIDSAIIHANLVDEERLDLSFTVYKDGRFGDNFNQFDYFNSISNDGFESVEAETTADMINCKLQSFT